MASGTEWLRKDLEQPCARPNLRDYAAECAAFRWEHAARALDGLPGGRGLNIAYEAVDRHARGPRAHATALRFLPRHGPVTDLSYAELAGRTNRFANLLEGLGVSPGDRVFALLPRIPALYVTALGALKQRAVFCPLFSAFGPEPVQQRLALGAGRVLVTTERGYRRKIEALRSRLPQLEHVLLTARESEGPPPLGTLDLDALLAAASSDYTIGATDPEHPALLHFTSGTTGTPKGALHVHQAAVAHHATARYALDLQLGDVFWCTADPGWVTGTSYGIVAPLLHGVTLVVDEGEFDPERWYRVLEQQRVSVWYTAPTAIRMLVKAGGELARRFDLSALRFVASVGEPLNAEAVWWGQRELDRPIHDNWWQTETGGIMLANFAGTDLKPGSIGRPLPGIEASLVRRRDDGGLDFASGPDAQGELALRAGWPSMFRAYLGEEERYRRCFREGWYLSGDLARRDADGFYWFLGRTDDLIKTAGHLIGPFEVESTLLQHPAVVEAGVIGKPDPVAGEVVKAFVALRAGHAPDEALRRDLLAFARARLGPAVAPREIEFRDALPHTRSGKILRRLLRAQELGLPPGDLSTLEGSAE